MTERFQHRVIAIMFVLVVFVCTGWLVAEEKKKDPASRFIDRVTDSLDVRLIIENSGSNEITLNQLIAQRPPRFRNVQISLLTADFQWPSLVARGLPRRDDGVGSMWLFSVDHVDGKKTTKLVKEIHHGQRRILKIDRSLSIEYSYERSEGDWPKGFETDDLAEEIKRVTYELDERAILLESGGGLNFQGLLSKVPPPRHPVGVRGRTKEGGPGSHFRYSWAALVERKEGRWNYRSVQDLERRKVIDRDNITYTYPFLPPGNRQ